MTHPLQQKRFRRISASSVRASKKVQLSRIGSRLRTFERAIDEVRTLHLTPQRVAQKANLSFKNRFSYTSVIDEANINLLLCGPCYAYCYQTAEARIMQL